MTIWEIIHILEIILWFVIAGSVFYVVFFAIISLLTKVSQTQQTYPRTANRQYAKNSPPLSIIKIVKECK